MVDVTAEETAEGCPKFSKACLSFSSSSSAPSSTSVPPPSSSSSLPSRSPPPLPPPPPFPGPDTVGR